MSAATTSAETSEETPDHTRTEIPESVSPPPVANNATLADIRAEIQAEQTRAYEAKLDIYRRIANDPSRDALLDALKQATEDQLISRRGIRIRVWETNLYFRFVISAAVADILGVRLERTDGELVSTHVWTPGETPGQFYGGLVLAVRTAGADLGVGLNDPTESVERLSELLIDISRLRSQELLGYRRTMLRIVQKEGVGDEDAWYLTEKALIPAQSPDYEIEYDRLDELDWAEHLRGKGWYGAEHAIHLARLMHAQLQRDV
ncbi:hypothetical protein [Nocardia sp. XZ_19_369]|uniref:hypothetical protein n=1 Tax=Nocardia sp. XZ_19_369 TaxID=2769487 RepID=UPI00188E74FF|nr:hypothetical protein [Nocardia sp. XZ_19_369]